MKLDDAIKCAKNKTIIGVNKNNASKLCTEMLFVKTLTGLTCAKQATEKGGDM